MSYKTSLLPDYISIVQQTSVNYYNTATNLLDFFSKYLGEINLNIEFTKNMSDYCFLTKNQELFKKLNDAEFTIDQVDATGAVTGSKELDDTFKVFFVEKYQSLNDNFKTIVTSTITDNVFFKPFSDDIGGIADTASVIDSNTSPYFDVYQTDYFLPTNMPATVITKISKQELQISKSFSFYTDVTHKRALSGLQTNVNANTASTAHGENLVTDILFYDRAVFNQLGILGNLVLILDSLAEFVMFYKQINPKDLDPERKAINFKYNITNLEGVLVTVDLLKSEIYKTERSIKDLLQ